MKEEKNKKNIFLNLIITIVFLVFLIIVFMIAPNYEKTDTYDNSKINLIINNNNVTRKLKYNLFVNDKNVIYMSKDDIANYFDKYIFFEQSTNEIITTYGEKVGVLPLNQNIVKINDSPVNILSGAIQKDGIYY